MLITRETLDALRVGFNHSFDKVLADAEPQWDKVATRVASATAETRYGWLGKMPKMREWIGERVINSIAEHDYSIKNKDWENTLSVARNDLEDDNLGIYSTLIAELARTVAVHPDELVWQLLKDGWSTLCYDGQNYFDTDHPVIGADGKVASVANTDGGSGAPWFLLDVSRSIKPVIYQERRKPEFVYYDNPKDARVFMNKEFLYGVDYRANVGFGFWQMAWGSKQTLNATNYAKARTAMSGFKADYGTSLAINPRLLVVGPENEAAAREILQAERNASGASNIWRDSAELLVTAYI